MLRAADMNMVAAIETIENVRGFPKLKSAPVDLYRLGGNCGPLSMWMVAKALGRDLDTETIVRVLQFDEQGTWPLRLAIGFKQLRFKVEYRAHSVHAPEPRLKVEAKENGVAILPPVELE